MYLVVHTCKSANAGTSWECLHESLGAKDLPVHVSSAAKAWDIFVFVTDDLPILIDIPRRFLNIMGLVTLHNYFEYM